MGLIVGKLTRPFRIFNIENRASAVISKDKPTPAPRDAASIKQLKLAQKVNPNFLENHYKKDVKLDEHLRNVYVTSTDPKIHMPAQPNPARPLPTSRTSEYFEFGFYVPDTASKGKCTLKEIFDIVTKHKEDSIKYNVNFLSTEYKLDKETVEKLLHYYKIYRLILPQKKHDDDEKSEIIHKSFNVLQRLQVQEWKAAEKKEN